MNKNELYDIKSRYLPAFLSCSSAWTRTTDPALTRNPNVSKRLGLYHYPVITGYRALNGVNHLVSEPASLFL